MTAQNFLKRLKAISPAKALPSQKTASENEDIVLGIGMGQVFSLAKEYMNM